MWFGAGGSLFGMLTPADPARARGDRAPIVIANAGCVNHVGPHRTTVSMARRWGALGFDVLRLDLAGIGESATAGGVENLVYPPSALGDLEGAIASLGGRRAIVAGLCSGGDYAFQMGIHSPNVIGAWMLNPRTFCVLDLTAVESDAGSAPPGNPVGDVPRSLRSRVERGVQPVLVVSRGDPGIAYVDAHAPAEMAALVDLPGFTRFDVSGADHTFTPVSTQDRVGDLLTEHLVGQY
jgi:pimeloyl-ACP methyl ester carboxylesterase